MPHLLRIRDILLSTNIITTSVFISIINAIPPGLVSKLRLVPDDKLAARLSHLLCVSNIEAGVEDLGFDYECLSVEGVDTTEYFIDHDAIVLNKAQNKVYIIDCTADRSLFMEKQRFMLERIKGVTNIDSARVHVFAGKTFTIDIRAPTDLYCSNSRIFNLLEKISLYSTDTKRRIFSACEEVYERACSGALCADQETLNSRYAAWTLPDTVISDAVKLCTRHDLTDAKMFKDVAEKSGTNIYFDTMEKILKQQKPLTPPFALKPAAYNTRNELSAVLESLSGNIIAKALAAAMSNTKKWVAIDLEDNIHINVSVAKSIRKVLPDGAMFKICAKQVEGHIFCIKFSNEIIDDNFREQILNAPKGNRRADRFNDDVITAYDECMKLYGAYHDEFMEPNIERYKNTITGKIMTISDLYSRDDIAPTSFAAATLSKVISAVDATMLGDMINHNYEASKTFAASLKCSPRDDYYYVGVNGAFKSVTIVRMSSTQDSFNVGSYFTIYEPSTDKIMLSVKSHYISEGKVLQSKTRTFNKNTLAHSLKLPYMFFSLLTWEIENNMSETSAVRVGDFNRLVINSILHISVNSDQFAQCAEQIRYLFTSNVGFGASASAICEKVDFIRANSLWEVLYIFRMLKMACGLNIVFRTKNIGRVINKGVWLVMFPNSVNEICSFSHLVSSMYYANIYNKFRAFHEVSEAICYNELEDENIIYLNACARNKRFVEGLSDEGFVNLNEGHNFNSDKFIETETLFCTNLVSDGPGRFKSSLAFIIGATRKHVHVRASDITSIYKSLGESPIDACTMHGSMSSGESTAAHQGIRAASSILEELIEETGDTADNINRDVIKASIFLDNLKCNPMDFSILSTSIRQFEMKGEYRYRIVQKDQKGHREISVLNAKFRLGALTCEKTALELSNLVPVDVLDNPNKDIELEQAVRDNLREASNHLTISDNSDQKRWGPNHLLHTFAAMFLALLSDEPGLFRIINLNLHYGESKFAKFPENLIDLIMKKDVTMSKSEPIQKFIDSNLLLMKENKFERQFEWGMCQGIFHRTSSLYHGIMCNAVSDVLKRRDGFPRHVIHSYVTSDDAERIIAIREHVSDRVDICRIAHSVINNVGCVMNILRNESKSVFSHHITEFNSIFYHDGYLATPTLKQRISKIDIGDGHDPLQDYLTSLSLAMGYFQNGGSYSGTVYMMILNVAMHTEQWNRWKYAIADKFRRPVSFGGFPVIEPLSVLYCGPISSMYLRERKICKPDIYALQMAKSTLVDAIEVDLADFDRTDQPRGNATQIKVLKSAGPMGVISLSRTDRRLSKFERRHRMSKWALREDFITLKKSEPDAGKFIFNLMKMIKTCQFEYATGVNSFYIRFTDPWVNVNRECLRLHPNSDFIKKVISFNPEVRQKISPVEYEAIVNNKPDSFIKEYFSALEIEKRTRERGNVIEARLATLMEDALNICEKMAGVEELTLQMTKNKNSIAKINFSSQSYIDEQEFLHSLLKQVVGEPIRKALIKKTGSATVWERIPEIPGLPRKEVIDGIFFCTNTIQLYDRYVRRSTKLICPGEEKPKDISDLLAKLLQHRYTEKFGLKFGEFPPLKTARLPSNAFKACNTELINRSIRFWREKETHIKFTEDYMPAEFGIASSHDVISAFDDFVIDENNRTEKVVDINAKGKFNFVQRIKMWTGATVCVRFDDSTKGSLLRSELTNFHEYCVSMTRFVKNQTGLLMNVKVGNVACFEMQDYDTESNIYRHIFLYDSSAGLIRANATLKDNTNTRAWATRLTEFINSRQRFVAFEEYPVIVDNKETRDTVRFIPVTVNDRYKIVTFPNNLTIFLRHEKSDVIIPVCSQQIDDMENIDLGIKYNKDDLKEAFTNFNVIAQPLMGKEPLTAEIEEFVKALLFRTSYFVGVEFINFVAEKSKLNIRVSRNESADLLRTLVLANAVKRLRGNSVRIQHYFLNLFRNSAAYNNGITSIVSDKISIRDAQMEEDVMTEMREDILDFNAPDEPAWAKVDATYDDPFKRAPEASTSAPAADLPAFDYIDILGDSDDDMFEGVEINFDSTNVDEAFVAETGLDEEVTRYKINPVAQLYTPNPAMEAGFSIAESSVINRHFEECTGIIRYMKKVAKSYVPKDKPTGIFMDLNTFFSAFQALSTFSWFGLPFIERAIEEMYGRDAPTFLDSNVPLSALCITELNFH